MADALAGRAAERPGYSRLMSIAHLKLRISEKFRKAKESWHKAPEHHGTEEILPPPPKKSCLDNMRNALARTAAQIRTSHWRSAVYLKRIRKIVEDKCWFCQNSACMTRSHVQLHFPDARLRAARTEACPGVVSQSQVGVAVCQVPGAVGGWKGDGRRRRCPCRENG
jgi:hypothetical protein